VFLASYVVAAIMTWMVYVRRPAPAPGLSGSAQETEAARV
jgi:NNP family nitrate/nitrite transporter-like MFS transporter